MRIDSYYRIFSKDFSWFTEKEGVGYVPTEKAPPEAVKAMEEYNRYTYGTEKGKEEKDK